MKTVFKLIQGDNNYQFGEVSFNGKFTFVLDENVPVELWNKIGFIHIDGTRCIESDDLFKHLNARLPIWLRHKPNDEKIAYIKKSNLRVVSDSFYLKEVSK